METTVAPLEKPRSRKDLNAIMDRLTKMTEAVDPLVPNFNISQLGVEVNLVRTLPRTAVNSAVNVASYKHSLI